MKHKHIITKCSSLLVQVYTQVLMKTTFSNQNHEVQNQAHKPKHESKHDQS